jgi:hypothetical protein
MWKGGGWMKRIGGGWVWYDDGVWTLSGGLLNDIYERYLMIVGEQVG